jgi:hypothetical protein
MESIEVTEAGLRLEESIGAARSEWDAAGLRPVAHWVSMPTAGGGSRLSMVWEVPDPIPPGPGA